jgi:predicted RNA-binding protein with PIN domain
MPPELPEDVAQLLVRAIGAYVHATDAIELPARLRPVKRAAQTAKGLARHRPQLLGMLDDDGSRARLLEWLDKGKPALSKDEVATLRAALGNEEGWATASTLSTSKKKGVSKPPAEELARIEKRLEREREVARKAKEDARLAREDKAKAVEAEAAKARALAKDFAAAKARIGELERDLRAARAEATAARKESERQKRAVRKAEEGAEAERDRLKARARAAEDSARELKSRSAPERSAPARPKAAEKPAAKPRGPRKVLKAPKGRLDTDPAALDAWLSRDDVHLIVDGYNVTRHEQGFAHLDLERQRDRLIEMVKVFATRKKLDATIVFDGSEMPPGTRRRKHGPVTVEYSKPDRSGKGDDRDRADDHIVELVEELPSGPVIVVTNDKELRDRVGSLKATVARSEQLLDLLR